MIPWNVATITNNRREPSDPLFRQFYDIGADGLTLDRQNRIISATLTGRDIERIDKNGKRTVLVDHYEGKRLGGPNDVVVTKDGSIYFTDTSGGTRGPGHDPKEELPPQGIYRFKDGKVTLIVSDIPTPNGLAFSPDEKYLYANSGRIRTIRSYDVQPDGTVKNGKLLIDLNTDKAPGVTDGMRVDAKGKYLFDGSWRRLDHFAGRKTSGHNSLPGRAIYYRHQYDVRRCGPQDALQPPLAGCIFKIRVLGLREIVFSRPARKHSSAHTPNSEREIRRSEGNFCCFYFLS